MTQVSFGVTTDEALAGFREVLGTMIVDKTLMEIENQKLKNTVTEQQVLIERMELQLAANQEQLNELHAKVEATKTKRYPQRKTHRGT